MHWLAFGKCLEVGLFQVVDGVLEYDVIGDLILELLVGVW